MTLAYWQTIWGGSALAAYAGTSGVPRAVWDFSQQVYTSGWSLARPSAAVTTTGAGDLVPVASDVARIVGAGANRGLMLEPASANRSSAPSAPISLAGVYKTGDTAATLSVADDTALLGPAGLGALTGGMAFLLDNSAGTGNARMALQRTVDSTGDWVASAWVRATGPFTLRTGYGGYPPIGQLPGDPAVTSGGNVRVRRDRTQKSAGAFNAADVLWCDIASGAKAWIALPQWEPGRTGMTSIIQTDGSMTSRAAETLVLSPPPGTYDITVTFADGSSTTTENAVVTDGFSVAAQEKRVTMVRAY